MPIIYKMRRVRHFNTFNNIGYCQSSGQRQEIRGYLIVLPVEVIFTTNYVFKISLFA